MRTGPNSDSSTIPKLGVSQGLALLRRRERLIENARLRSNLSSKYFNQLQISNRERMARRWFSLFSTTFDHDRTASSRAVGSTAHPSPAANTSLQPAKLIHGYAIRRSV